MSKRSEKSALDAYLEGAKRFGVSVDETKRIHSIVSANTTADVRSFEVTFGSDSTDQAAVWIKLLVDKNLPQTDAKITELNRATTAIRSELLKSEIPLWPYVTIRSSS